MKNWEKKALELLDKSLTDIPHELGGLMLNSRIPRWEELNASSLLAENEVLALLDAYAIHSLLKRPSPSTK